VVVVAVGHLLQVVMLLVELVVWVEMVQHHHYLEHP
jgi:hypothetical protein